MLAIQEYLKAGHTPEDLRTEFQIDHYRHPELPLVGFKYRQDAPRFHPVVRDARGVVLEDETWELVARPFRRFYNLGESPEDEKEFDFTDFEATSKEDGSLIILANYKGHWLVNTSGSFGFGKVGWSEKPWRTLFWEVSGIQESDLDPRWTYIFEMWTPFNKVVRTYQSPQVWLLSGYHIGGGWECTPSWRYMESRRLGIKEPDTYQFRSAEEVQMLLEERSRLDSTYEGVVLRDRADNRIKVKTQSYLALHYFYDNGACLAPKRLVPLYLSGDQDEVLLHFPEIKPHLDEVGKKIGAAFFDLVEVWKVAREIESQKEFAQYIAPRTPFNAILFQHRKIMGFGLEGNEINLFSQFSRNGDLIHRKLYEEAKWATNRKSP